MRSSLYKWLAFRLSPLVVKAFERDSLSLVAAQFKG